MSAAEFHGALDAMFGDKSAALLQVLRFYGLSDDGRRRELFGCDHRALRRTLDALKLALEIALGPGGEFAGCTRAIWHPWHGKTSEALSLRPSAMRNENGRKRTGPALHPHGPANS